MFLLCLDVWSPARNLAPTTPTATTRSQRGSQLLCMYQLADHVLQKTLFHSRFSWCTLGGNPALDSQVPHTRPLTRRNINIQYVSPTHPCGPFCTSPGEKRLLSNLVRSNIQDLTPYRCARDDYSQGVLLDANENSFGPALVATQVAKRRGK